MGVEFIYDENLDKAKKDLNKVVETIQRTPLNKKALLLRRFFFACVKAVEILDSQKILMQHREEFNRIKIKRVLPTPPSPQKQLVPLHLTLPTLPEPPSPIFA